MPLTQRPPAARDDGPPTNQPTPHPAAAAASPGAALPGEWARRLREEAALLERFVECYERQFNTLVRRLNDSAPPTAAPDDAHAQSLRLCVEAVGMMLAIQGQMARALREIGPPAAEEAADEGASDASPPAALRTAA